MEKREIKFRAWREHSGKMQMVTNITWGSVVTFGDISGISTEEHDLVHTVPLMQFTGLLDKNGKEIYEGDILDFEPYEWNRTSMKPKSKWEHPKWVVEWNTEEGAWDTGGGTTRECSSYKAIIGNIYEHPSLLGTSLTHNK